MDRGVKVKLSFLNTRSSKAVSAKKEYVKTESSTSEAITGTVKATSSKVVSDGMIDKTGGSLTGRTATLKDAVSCKNPSETITEMLSVPYQLDFGEMVKLDVSVKTA